MSRQASRFRLFLLAALLAAVSALAQQEKPQAEAESPRQATTDEARERAAAILAAALDAAGGAALTKVGSLELTVRKAESTAQGTLVSDEEIWLTFPSQIRMEHWVVQSWVKGGYSSSGRGPITPMQTEEVRTFTSAEGYDGSGGWLKTPRSVTHLPQDEAVQFRIDLLGGLGLYRRATQGTLAVTFVGEETLLGRKVFAVTLGGIAGPPRLYFDPETHLLVGVKYPEASAEGTFETLQVWSDFRRLKFKPSGKEHAVQFPYAWTTYRSGRLSAEEKVKKLKFNSYPDPKKFARPK